MMTSARIDEALARIKGLFLEVPGTAINSMEACRLTGLDESTCVALLGALEQARFLCRSQSGKFLLRADSPYANDDRAIPDRHVPRNQSRIALS